MTAHRVTASDKRKAFRTILQGEACIRPASVFDPLSAVAAEEIGYEAAMLAGSIASLSVLGAPDLAVLTLPELTEQARRICRAGNVPLLVDADHGYGNALNVRRTIEELECAGIAALTIEDTHLPAAFGAGSAAQLILPQEAAGKLRAAIDARSDPSLAIVGRTNATLVRSVDELLQRQALYQSTGIDALFISGLKNPDHLDALAEAATVPLILGGPLPGFDAAYLAARKVRLCLQGHQAFFQAVSMMYTNLARLRKADHADDIDPQELVKRLSKSDVYKKWDKDFLS